MNPSSTHYMQAYPYQAYAYAGTGAVDGLRQRAYSQEWPSSFCPMPIRGTQSWPGQPRTTRPPSIWEEDLRQLPTGEIGVVGLRNQYGEVLRHKKGQHIRKIIDNSQPSRTPVYRDYCNLRVKGLGNEVDDAFFQDIVKAYDGFYTSQVARDGQARPRGYGFASYETVPQAEAALKAMNGQKCGSKTMVISYHEPKVLQPDKRSLRAG